MRNLYLYILSIVVVFVLVLVPSAYAQQDFTPGLDSPGTVNKDEIINPDRGTADTTTDTLRGVDWRWLLPLLAIPISFILWRYVNAEEIDTRYSDKGQYSLGYKGGKSKMSKKKPERSRRSNK